MEFILLSISIHVINFGGYTSRIPLIWNFFYSLSKAVVNSLKFTNRMSENEYFTFKKLVRTLIITFYLSSCVLTLFFLYQEKEFFERQKLYSVEYINQNNFLMDCKYNSFLASNSPDIFSDIKLLMLTIYIQFYTLLTLFIAQSIIVIVNLFQKKEKIDEEEINF